MNTQKTVDQTRVKKDNFQIIRRMAYFPEFLSNGNS